MSIFVNCFRKMTQQSKDNELKGYKVTNVDRTRRFGVACRNLHDLKSKACAKFQISDDEAKSVTVCLVDGSEIDEEYFLTLEPQTTLILQRRGERLLSDADILYNNLRRVNLQFITTGDAISKFLSENLKTKVAVLNKALNHDDTKTALTSRNEHPEWFRNLDTTASTKEAYMHRRCQDRIRTYLYKTIEQIKGSETWASNERARRHLAHTISFFKLQLKEDHCMGFYFDRSYAAKNSNLTNASQRFEDERDAAGDETEIVFVCPYDHCPCRISDDETDARKVSPSKKVVVESEDALVCPFAVRSAGEQRHAFLALCDANGQFKCDGLWNAERCAYGDRHSINPYRSYEELVLFSTWNFDHRIERSRTLIPDLLKASEKDTISQTEARYFYDNIFTIKNLRLVHIICHDKGAHKLQ